MARKPRCHSILHRLKSLRTATMVLAHGSRCAGHAQYYYVMGDGETANGQGAGKSQAIFARLILGLHRLVTACIGFLGGIYVFLEHFCQRSPGIRRIGCLHTATIGGGLQAAIISSYLALSGLISEYLAFFWNIFSWFVCTRPPCGRPLWKTLGAGRDMGVVDFGEGVAVWQYFQSRLKVLEAIS
ncbi:MAG: hypothetical protein JWR26_1775 [Pedosphaera sp.]|nr:hypothetical protein [Pedosphaera sp.]